MPTITLVDVMELKPAGDHALWLKFSDGADGVRDFTDILAEGGTMVEPLREPVFFKRAFISFGVPTWPNGYAVDAINLYMELRDAGAPETGESNAQALRPDRSPTAKVKIDPHRGS